MKEARLEDSGSGLAPAEEAGSWSTCATRPGGTRTTSAPAASSRAATRLVRADRHQHQRAPCRASRTASTTPSPSRRTSSCSPASARCSSRVRSGPCGQWDFVHCPAGTKHVFVGAGDGPCAILMVGARTPDESCSTPSRSSRRSTARARRWRPPRQGGVRALRAAPAREAAVLGPASLGLTARSRYAARAGLVGAHLHARVARDRRDELERVQRAVLGEDALPAAEDHRHHDQPQLVGEALVQQRAGERRAAHHDQVAAVGCAQLADAGDGVVARDQGGVVPRQLVLGRGSTETTYFAIAFI